MDREAAATLASCDHWFRYWMPWAFVRFGFGRQPSYLPVNRGLRPLGVLSGSSIRWRDHAATAIVFRTDPYEFEGVWYEVPKATPEPAQRRRLILYDDTPESRMDYFIRFERLMARASRLNGAPVSCHEAEALRDELPFEEALLVQHFRLLLP